MLVLAAYGLTEMSPVATVPLFPAKNLATVGVPLSNTLGKIINPETGEALGPNQSGELCFKGPQVMLGYHNNPKATAGMIDPEGWLMTGDIGYYEEDGHFYVQDRLKELIKVKGLQVPPAELEELLRTHPLVSDVGVIGVPDPRSGEVPVAYIVPQKHSKKLTAEHIKQFLSERVSRHKQLADVIFTDSIPKSAAGKILRKDLRELYKNQKKMYLH
ncbi:hypothetical protein J6590_025191 [Homalodisca vitripennis]|nr:hypothetical protein J6590_025191 [Homalodisca vitripennis]